jgi:NodT family efflux transporter outer membrane factor (OMF) lipoprotein
MTRGWLAPGLAVLLAGCATGPRYVAPSSPLPPTWSLPTSGTSPVDLERWWAVFGDLVLDGLVDRALADNLDVAAAATRVRQARALRSVAGADRLPSLDYDGGASRIRTRAEGAGGASVTGNRFDAELAASWEVDLFGRIAQGVRAADADLDASVEDRRAVQVALVADIVRTYVDLRGIDARLAIARDNLNAQNETARISASRFRVGETSGVDDERARAQARATAAQIPGLEAERSVLVHRLALLLGQPPAALDTTLAAPAALATPSVDPAAGVPADLLRNRPDVRAAERRVAASWARVGLARADLLPRLTLSGSVGALAPALSGATVGQPFVWSIGAGLFGPLFDGGRRRATLDYRVAQRDEVTLHYRRAVLSSAGEVEDALVRYDRERQRGAALADAASGYASAATRVRSAWKNGEAPFLDVLDADRSRLSAEDALAQSRIAQSETLVALYAALGAGWTVIEKREAQVRQAGRTNTGGS